MVSKKRSRRKRCKNCGSILDAIWFTALMTEEWSWNGESYNECTAKHSLTTDPDSNVNVHIVENWWVQAVTLVLEQVINRKEGHSKSEV